MDVTLAVLLNVHADHVFREAEILDFESRVFERLDDGFRVVVAVTGDEKIIYYYTIV